MFNSPTRFGNKYTFHNFRLGSSVVEQTFHKRRVVSPILTLATQIKKVPIQAADIGKWRRSSVGTSFAQTAPTLLDGRLLSLTAVRGGIDSNNLAITGKIIFFTDAHKATIPRAKSYFFAIREFQFQTTLENKIDAIIF